MKVATYPFFNILVFPITNISNQNLVHHVPYNPVEDSGNDAAAPGKDYRHRNT